MSIKSIFTIFIALVLQCYALCYMPLYQPIKSKTLNHCDFLARVFPCLVLATCICFEF